MDKPEFKVDFDVENAEPEDYKKFIEDLRTRLTSGTVHTLPTLRAQESRPEHWFEVKLRTDGGSVTLGIRSDNLYAYAYRVNDRTPQWFEFPNEANAHMIQGSQFLGFSGTYSDIETRADRRREQTDLGQPQLRAAVNSLLNRRPIREQARALIVIIQMISESMRLRLLTDHLVRNWYVGAIPEGRVFDLENGWGITSTAVIQASDADHFRMPHNTMGIVTLADAVALIAMLLVRTPRTSSSRAPRMVANSQAVPQFPIGRPLVELFWVRINNIDDENPGDLYGTITAVDGLSTQYLYNCPTSDAQSVRPNQDAQLTGPSRAISAADNFVIDVSLYDRNKDASPDDEICKEQISWNVYDPFNDYDNVHNLSMRGKYGAATISYIVLSDASEALIEVILIN